MNTIYSSAATLTITMTICVILRMFFPGEKTQKILTLILALFVITSLITPFVEIIKGIRTETEDSLLSVSADNAQNAVDEKVFAEAGAYLSEYACSLANNAGYTTDKTEVSLKRDKNSGIYVDKLVIYLDSKNTQNCDKLKSLLSETLGVEADIVCCRGD